MRRIRLTGQVVEPLEKSPFRFLRRNTSVTEGRINIVRCDLRRLRRIGGDSSLKSLPAQISHAPGMLVFIFFGMNASFDSAFIPRHACAFAPTSHSPPIIFPGNQSCQLHTA